MATISKSEQSDGPAEGTVTPPVSWRLVHAQPGALIYAAPGPADASTPVRHERTEWTPSGVPATHESPHETHDHPVLHYAGYIGRVGVLAAALGVGAAVVGTSGTATAEPADSSSSTGQSRTPTRRAQSDPGTRSRADRSALDANRAVQRSEVRGSGVARGLDTVARDSDTPSRRAEDELGIHTGTPHGSGTSEVSTPATEVSAALQSAVPHAAQTAGPAAASPAAVPPATTAAVTPAAPAVSQAAVPATAAPVNDGLSARPAGVAQAPSTAQTASAAQAA